jgi:hypothetical protein
MAMVMESWRRFLTAKPFFFNVFGIAVENHRHFFAATQSVQSVVKNRLYHRSVLALRV